MIYRFLWDPKGLLIGFCFVWNFCPTHYKSRPCESPEDSFVQEIEMVQEDLLANDLVIDGEYMSEETMKHEWGWNQQPSGIKNYMLHNHTSR